MKKQTEEIRKKYELFDDEDDKKMLKKKKVILKWMRLKQFPILTKEGK